MPHSIRRAGTLAGALLLAALLVASPGTSDRAAATPDSPHGPADDLRGSRSPSVETGSPPTLSGGWYELSPERAPPDIEDPAMAYDAADQYVVEYGGYNVSPPVGGEVIDQTWIYADSAWTNVTANSPDGPVPQLGSMMAYDPAAGYVVLFGGGSRTSSNVYPGTWKFLHGHWSDLTAGDPNATNTPSWRLNGSLAYDPALQALVLYGGAGNLDDPQPLNQTWTYANGTWSNLTGRLPSGPPPLTGASIAWDAVNNELVLFGGWTTGGTALNETWGFVNSSWVRIVSAETPAPPATGGAYFAWDPADGYDVWYGGGETWAFDNGSWERLAVSTQPGTANLSEEGTYDAADGYDLLFGGESADEQTNGTWFYSGHLLSITSLSRRAIDASESVQVNTTAYGPFSRYTFQYSGLPGNCRPGNVSTFTCEFETAGSYVLAVNVSSGDEFDNRSINLTVYPPLTITAAPIPSAIDLGTVTNYTVVASGGSGSLTFSYADLPGGCSTYNVTPLPCQPNEVGSYSSSVTAIDLSGAVVRAHDLNLTVYPALNASLAPGFVSLDLGETFAFHGNASGGHGAIVPGWVGLPSGCAPGPVWNFTCRANATGVWRVYLKATDATPHTVTTGPGEVVVNPLPTVVLTASARLGFAPFSVVFSGVPANGTPPYQAVWNFGDGTGSLRNASTVVTHTFLEPGNFTVEISGVDAQNGTFSAQLPIDVVAPLAVHLRAAPHGDVLDAGEPLELLANVTGGGPPLAFQWVGLPPSCAAADVANLTCPDPDWGSYRPTVTVTDSLGENVTSSVDLTIARALSVALRLRSARSGCTLPYVEGATAEVSGGVGPFQYTWTSGGTLAAGANANASYAYDRSGRYPITVTVTDATTGAVNATATASVGPTGCPAEFLGIPLTLSGWGVLGAGIAGIALLGIGILWRRRSGPGRSSAGAVEDGSSGDPESTP